MRSQLAAHFLLICETFRTMSSSPKQGGHGSLRVLPGGEARTGRNRERTPGSASRADGDPGTCPLLADRLGVSFLRELENQLKQTRCLVRSVFGTWVAAELSPSLGVKRLGFPFLFYSGTGSVPCPGAISHPGENGEQADIGIQSPGMAAHHGLGSGQLRGQAGDPGGPIRNFQQARPGPGRGLPGGRCGVPDIGSVTSRTPSPPCLVTVALSSGNHSQAQETPSLGGCWGSLRGSGSQETLLGPKSTYSCQVVPEETDSMRNSPGFLGSW